MDVRILRQREIRELLSFAEAIAAVEKSFADYSSGWAVVPGVINLDIEEHEAEIHVKSAYLRGSALVITATPSRTALVKAEWLGPGVHITALGSDRPEKQELDVGILKQADLVYCDSIVQCARLGEVHHALEAKVIERDGIAGELGDIILGRKAGRENDRQISIADLTGLGVQDAAAATLVYEKAVRRHLGQFIEI